MTFIGPPVLASRERIAAHQKDGLWGHSSLPDVLFRHIRAQPDRMALADAPNGPGTERILSYARADLEMRRLAARFERAGLTPGDVVAIQMPPTVESVLAIMTCLGLGFIVCPLPMPWRRLEIEQALSLVAARAIITWSADGDFERVDAACRAAFGVPSIRFVFGFGAQVPDGVTPLPLVSKKDESDNAAPSLRAGFPVELDANALALITWDFADGSPRALGRSHNEWIAAGTSVLLEAQLGDGASILSPYALSGLAGIAGALLPWLMTAGALTLHRPFNLDHWRRQLDISQPDLALMPAALAPAFLENDVGNTSLPRTLALIGEVDGLTALPESPAMRVIELQALGEIAFVPKHLEPAAQLSGRRSIAIGAVQTGGSDGPALFETRLSGEHGQIEVRGASVPSAILAGSIAGGFQPPGDSEGFLASGVVAERDQDDPNRARLIGRPPGTVRHGAAAVSLQELDSLYASLDAVSDAAAVAVEDRIMGKRLVAAIVPSAGQTVTLEEVAAQLASKGVALYKFPDRLLVIDQIPRTPDGVIERDRLLAAG